jgi:glycosyltransferase involved in cell wall biosynthesis
MSGQLQKLESWIRELDSSLSSYEVLIIHDISDPRTQRELIELHAHQPSWNLTIEAQIFGGPGAARNRGLELARGKWVTFWDSDDCPRVQGLVDMIYKAEKHNYDLVIGKFEIFDETTGKIQKIETRDLADVAINPGIWRFLFKGDLVRSFRFPSLYMGEDQVFLLQVLDGASNLKIINTVVYEYRVGQARRQIDSITPKTHPGKSFKSMIQIRIVATILSRLGLSTFVSVLKKTNLKSIFRMLKISPLFLGKLARSGAYRRFCKKQSIFVIVAGGLGNQLFQISAALNHSNLNSLTLCIPNSQLRKNRQGHIDVLDLDWSAINVHLSVIHLGYVSTKIANYFLRTQANRRQIPLGRNAATLYFTLRYKVRIKIISATGIGWGELPASTSRATPLYVGYFQSYRFSIEAIDKLRIVLKSKKTSSISTKPREILVHIRLTDYIGNLKTLDTEYYRDAIGKIWNTKKFDSIHVFSDDIESARNILPREYAHIAKFDANVDESVTELLKKMTKYGGYVLGNSSLSWWAANLRELVDAPVLYPDPWFGESDSPAELCPKNWVPIPTSKK